MSGGGDLRAEMRRVAERFGHRAAALYPLLNHEVPTPEGPGELVQVFGQRCRVIVGWLGAPEVLELERRFDQEALSKEARER